MIYTNRILVSVLLFLVVTLIGACGGANSSTIADVVEQVVLEAKYSGYIDRQTNEVERFRRMEGKRIPGHFDYSAVPQLRREARDKLSRVRPTSLGQASRVSGITPADLAVLLFYLK